MLVSINMHRNLIKKRMLVKTNVAFKLPYEIRTHVFKYTCIFAKISHVI